MSRKILIALALLATVLPSAPATAAHQSDVIVAMIDTGVYPWHSEFDYRGKDSPDDQFVAWWDFSQEYYGLDPMPGQTWDPRYEDPFDVSGHGTATAAMAVGRGYSWPSSLAPGFKLAVAKVASYSGITGNIATAIRWAVDTVKARVINISIGTRAPYLVANSAAIYEALRHARQSGTLVVVSNGNGFLNSAIAPGEPGWAKTHGSSTDVLTVGASSLDGVFVSTDPEVAAPYTVYTACDWHSWCYEEVSGTSFAAPLVAGMAAWSMQTLIDNGSSVSIDWVEQLLKYSARDTEMPPTFEGYGVLDEYAFWDRLRPAARAGRLPARPIPDLNQVYVDGVTATLRDTWSNKLRRVFVPAGPSQTEERQIGISANPVSDAELYRVSLEPGDQLTIYAYFELQNNTDDIDIRLFPAGGPFDEARVVASSKRGGGQYWESFSYTSQTRADYTLFVSGWAVTGATRIHLYSWSNYYDDRPLRFLSQGTYAATLP